SRRNRSKSSARKLRLAELLEMHFRNSERVNQVEIMPIKITPYTVGRTSSDIPHGATDMVYMIQQMQLPPTKTPQHARSMKGAVGNLGHTAGQICQIRIGNHVWSEKRTWPTLADRSARSR